jgi:hypothetical protein
MALYGIDQVRDGCFDAVERKPAGGWPIECAWENTKDFWQQEQAILAYLIVHGSTGEQKYLDLAREMMAFWNLYFLDHDNRGVFFRVTDGGIPVIPGAYSQKAGHAIAGYHSFELNYLAHTLSVSKAKSTHQPATQLFPSFDQTFCLFFCPDQDCPHTTLNVLPDFVPPGAVEIVGITVKGVPPMNFAPDKFHIELEREDLGGQIVVEFCPKAPPRPSGDRS